MEEPVRRRPDAWRSRLLPLLVVAGVAAPIAVAVASSLDQWDRIPASALTVAGVRASQTRANTADLARFYATCESVTGGGQELITSATSSPDGKRILTTSLSGVARLWAAARTDECRWERDFVAGHPLYNAAYSPDGRHVALVGEGSSVTILNVANGAPTRSIDTGRPAVMSATFSAEPRWLATLSWGGVLQLWALETGKQVTLLEAPGHARWAAFFADGETVLVGLDGGGVIGWRRRGFHIDPHMLLRGEFLLAVMGLVAWLVWIWRIPGSGLSKGLSIFSLGGKLP